MSTLIEHARRVPPGAIVAGVIVVAGAWWLAVQMRADEERRTPDWRAGDQPPEIVSAGPWANWAATCPPGINSACEGRSVGATARVYPGSLLESDTSIIGSC